MLVVHAADLTSWYEIYLAIRTNQGLGAYAGAYCLPLIVLIVC
jgi:hypothetical protein